MRTAFIKKLTDLAEKDSRIMLLVGDLGFGVVTDFAKRFPKQFFNLGIAEQNMTGVAVGLAMSGKVVFTYSIGNFPILRSLEQFRNNVCYHRANVVAVSIGAGFAYGSLGMTHQALEDIAIMRSLPHTTVIAPGDPVETEAATEYLAQGVGPAYLRLGRAGEPIVHAEPIEWKCGRAIEAVDGSDATIIATGGMLETAVTAAKALRKLANRSVRVLSMHTIKPLDVVAVHKAARETGRIVALEEHSIIGGLGGAIAETLAESGIPTKFRRIGTPSIFAKEVGSQNYLKKIYKLDVESVVAAINKMFD